MRALPSALLLLAAVRCAAGADDSGSTPAVTARLSVPEAEINVIGDPVTLTWHFTNPTAKPLAFVWEACCRLNGRLVVSQDGRDLPRIPPGPASAHAFAKPAIILPGRENAFESLLADWVFLQRGGRYQLRGHYVGVLPEQKPPYPPSVGLWRGEVATAPISVSLVTVEEYLAQRPARVAQRGLDATLAGDGDLPPRTALLLEARLRNSGTQPLELTWPLDANLWLVDAEGRRVHRSPTRPTGTESAVRLAPGEEWRTNFPVTAQDLGGAPFGAYRAFLDFPARLRELRTPSKPHAFRWSVSAATAAGLLDEATRGTPNPRNPAMRLLRQYLEPLAEVLGVIDPAALTPAAETLRSQLRLAARLRALPLTAGRLEVTLTVGPGGTWQPADPVVARAVDMRAERPLADVLAARRHLGVDAAVSLAPANAATVGDLVRAAAALAPHAGELAGPPRFVGDAPAGAVPGTVSFPLSPAPAHLVLMLGPGATAALARSTGSPPLAPAASWRSLPRTALADPAGLERSLADSRGGTPQVALLADSALRWEDVLPWLTPLLRRGWNLELLTLPDPSP